MLVRKSQCFDLKEIWLTQQAIDVNAQGMSGQLAVQTGTQPPKSRIKPLMVINKCSR